MKKYRKIKNTETNNFAISIYKTDNQSLDFNVFI